MNEETPSGGGSGTTHTTYGIVIQGLENDAETEEHAEYQVPKSKIRSFEADAEGPLPFARKSNAEPVSPVDDEVSTNTRFDETPVAHIIGHCSITTALYQTGVDGCQRCRQWRTIQFRQRLAT